MVKIITCSQLLGQPLYMEIQLTVFNSPPSELQSVQIIQNAKLTVPFNIVSQWSVSNSAEAICL